MSAVLTDLLLLMVIKYLVYLWSCNYHMFSSLCYQLLCYHLLAVQLLISNAHVHKAQTQTLHGVRNGIDWRMASIQLQHPPPFNFTKTDEWARWNIASTNSNTYRAYLVKMISVKWALCIALVRKWRMSYTYQAIVSSFCISMHHQAETCT